MSEISISKGKLTWDSEGYSGTNESATRKTHFPGGASGVTIGRGYDMKLKSSSKITKDLINAGVNPSIATQLADGSGLAAENAKKFAERFSNFKLAPEVEKKLFDAIYQEEASEAKRISTKKDVTEKYGKTDWDKLNPKIKELVIDLKYAGNYTSKVRTKIQKYIAGNDLEGLKKVMSDSANWANVAKNRIKNRIESLK